MKTRHSKQVLVGLSVFSDRVLHFLQIKKKFLPKLSCGFKCYQTCVFDTNTMHHSDIYLDCHGQIQDKSTFEAQFPCQKLFFSFFTNKQMHMPPGVVANMAVRGAHPSFAFMDNDG